MRITTLLAALTLTTAIVGVADARNYDLVIDRQKMEIEPGRKEWAITLNGSVPGPVLRFTDGEQATIRVTNHLKETAAIHWHGLLIKAAEDGAPGFNGFMGVKPGATYTYSFKLRQSGTYWYHAHSATQEQAGQYGAFIIEPKTGPAIKADRDYVVLLSEATRTQPERILRNLKSDSSYYNFNRRTTPEFFRDVGKFGLKKTLADRRAWDTMRMDPTDIADVGNYTLLVNGQPTARKPDFRFTPGERVHLRLINGSAMSFMDFRIPGLTMTVVGADGLPVQPVKVDEMRLGVAETYDVIVEPKDDRAYPLWVETLDRRASVLAALSPHEGMAVAAPAPRPHQVLLMSDMGMAMGDMAKGGTTPASGGGAHAGHSVAANGAMATMDMGNTNAAAPVKSADSAMTGMDMSGGGSMAGMDIGDKTKAAPGAKAMAGMDMGTRTAAKPATAKAIAGMDMSGGGTMAGMAMPTAARDGAVASTGSAVALAARAQGGTPYPKVDYGFGSDSMSGGKGGGASMAGMNMSGDKAGGAMAGMDMSGGSSASMGGMKMGAAIAREGDTDGSGRVLGWATGAPYGARVLSMRDLRSATPNADVRQPTREMVVKISGNMQRYIWTLNGAKFGEAPPIRMAYNERVRITFVNETMMAHPMHLHGMFFEVENGQPMDRLPSKNVISVAPGKTQSVILTANEPGEWPLHCHLLYHMESGMMQKVIVANPDGSAPPSMVAMAGMGE